MTAGPRVAIVTPVYNGARFLADAIKSVLAQTYADWTYLVCDNGSTDDSYAIAERYATRDRRVRVMRLPHLQIIDNWNRLFGLIEDDTVYVKELHADDLLMPNCLAELVALMERHPTAGLASSYCLYDATVSNVGLPHGSELLRGHDVIRSTLLGEYYVFGAPSQVMIRYDVIRAMQPAVYDRMVRHPDLDLWYRILERHDFGFVHQILSCERTHAETQTNTFSAHYTTLALEHFCFLRHYGLRYLDAADYRRGHRRLLMEYRRRIARRMVGGGGRDYWRYQERHLARYGYRLTVGDLAVGVAIEIGRWVTDAGHAATSRAKLADKVRRHKQRKALEFAMRASRLLATRHLVLRRAFFQALSSHAD